MATIEDKLTAEVVPIKPFTYDQARLALQAHPRQKAAGPSQAEKCLGNCEAMGRAAIDRP
jgi:hypothetical protein